MDKRIIIDTDTLNDGADYERLAKAIAAEFSGVSVSVWNTCRGTEFIGFGEDMEDAYARFRAIVDRLDF